MKNLLPLVIAILLIAPQAGFADDIAVHNDRHDLLEPEQNWQSNIDKLDVEVKAQLVEHTVSEETASWSDLWE
ncbi:MAG: hypothetical protein AAF387_17020 [Pseudomonadota bacterium]